MSRARAVSTNTPLPHLMMNGTPVGEEETARRVDGVEKCVHTAMYLALNCLHITAISAVQTVGQPISHTTNCLCCSPAPPPSLPPCPSHSLLPCPSLCLLDPPTLTVPPLIPNVEHSQCEGGCDRALGHGAVVQVALLCVPFPCGITHILAQDHIIQINGTHAAEHLHLGEGRGEGSVGVFACVCVCVSKTAKSLAHNVTYAVCWVVSHSTDHFSPLFVYLDVMCISFHGGKCPGYIHETRWWEGLNALPCTTGVQSNSM